MTAEGAADAQIADKDAIDSINHDVHLAFALLARRYNSRVPINRLHPELLGMVFEYLRVPTNSKILDAEESFDQPVFALYKPLVHAMTVCHKWYIVALEKASLWTDVDYLRGPSGPNCLLQRSGTAPIHLRVLLDGPPHDVAPFPEIVRMNAPRLRHLDVWMTGPDTTNTVEQLLKNDMPLLRSLKLTDEYYQMDAISGNALGKIPSLKGMILLGTFWLPTPEVVPFAKLTHLQVSVMPEIPLAWITTFLAATPALEVLEMHECVAVTLTSLPTSMTTLEHLTHLTIRQLSTRAAEALMPALSLPRATAVFLWLDVDSPPTDALLPHPQHWLAATRIRVDEGPYGSLAVDLEAPLHRVALRLECDAAGEWDPQALWPLPVPTLAALPSITEAHLSVFGRWGTALPQFVARFPALAALVVEAPPGDQEAAGEMVVALRDVLLSEPAPEGGAEGARRCVHLKDVALMLPRAMPGFTGRLAPALERRRRDGLQVERLRVWIAREPGDDEPEAAPGEDVGDALEEHVGAGRVEHEEGAFWPRDEERWRRENEFWEVPRAWW